MGAPDAVAEARAELETADGSGVAGGSVEGGPALRKCLFSQAWNRRLLVLLDSPVPGLIQALAAKTAARMTRA